MKKRNIIFIIVVIFIMTLLYFNNFINIPCVFYELTSLYCPGCGITRVVISLIHGDIYQAFRYNILLFIDIPVLILLYIINLKYGKNKRIKKIINIVLYILLIITILFGVLRNIPVFGFLAPTIILR